MGKDVTKNSPKKNQKAAKSSSAEFIARIEQLEKMLIHTKKKRIGQSITVWSCTAVIIITCLWFLMTFNNLRRSFDTKLLAQELQKSSGIVIQSPQFRAMLMDTKKIFLPAYTKALKTKLNSQTPQLRAKAEAELVNLKELAVKKIQQNFVAQIRKDFNKIEKDLLKRYPDLNAAELNDAYNKAASLFAEKLSVSLNHFVTQATNKLSGLDETFRQFKKENVYKELNKKSVKEVESLLMESMLELWIYELNPAKGEKIVEAQSSKSAKRNK
jgi:hypothetical protein